MAVSSNESYDKFNPKIPDIEGGNYLGLSRAPEQPRFASKSGLADIGHIVAGAINASDEIIKADMRDTAAKEGQPIADAETANLERLRASVYGSGSATSNLPNTSKFVNDALAGNTIFGQGAIPKDLRSIESNLTMMQNARANGTYSDTHYEAKKNEFLRSLRSRYPEGYRNYASQVAASVLNEPIANEYRASMTKDINAAVGKLQQEREKMFSQILEAGKMDPEQTDIIIRGVQSGNIDIVTGLTMANKIKNQEYKLHIQLQEAAVGDKTREGQQRLAGDIAETVMTRPTADYYDLLLKSTGFKDIEAMQSHFKNNFDEAKAKELAETGRLLLIGTERKLNEEMDMPRKEFGGRSLRQVLPEGEAAKRIKSRLEAPQNFVAGLVDKEAGAAYAARNWMVQSQAAYEAGLLSTSDAGPALRKFKAIRDFVGDYGMQWVVPEIGGVDAAMKGYIWHNNTLVATGSVNPNTGRRYNIQDEINLLQERGKATPEGVKALIDSSRNIILDNTTAVEVRRNFVERLFSPETYKFVSRLDPSKQTIIFNQLVDPKFMEAVKATGQQHFDMYKDWVNSTTTNAFLVPAIQDLNQLTETAERPLQYKAGEGKNPPKFLTDNNDPIWGLDKINTALLPLSEINANEKGDINARVYLLFKQLGANKRVLSAIENSLPLPAPGATP